MHDWGFLVPIGVVSAIMARGAFTTWVKAKHGYPLEDRSRPQASPLGGALHGNGSREALSSPTSERSSC